MPDRLQNRGRGSAFRRRLIGTGNRDALYIGARVFAVLLWLPSACLALDASDFAGLEGWSVAAVTRVNDRFEGCEFDRKVRFENGWVLTCSTYAYDYTDKPGAVIFVKTTEYHNQPYWNVKVLIDDKFHEMLPIPAK
jgi:hypothetical protein